MQLPCTILPVCDDAGVPVARMRRIDEAILNNNAELQLLVAWRNEGRQGFPHQDRVTLEGTRAWITHLLQGDEKSLYFVEAVQGESTVPFAVLGFADFDPKKRSCEIFYAINGRRDTLPGAGKLFYRTIMTFGRWFLEQRRMEQLYLHIMSNNEKALQLYRYCGYQDVGSIPLRKEEKDGVTNWERDVTIRDPEIYLIRMVQHARHA